ncbi:MAG: hypothetical protein BECKG1743D_GA0114223_100924 [Candidatus Kentron sp. G]|nr:MAG: hypothetical protein BECKG1743D_GA0114223_100924 [Candidatus Kentron sp. G]
MVIYFDGDSAFSLLNLMIYRAWLWDTIRLLHSPRLLLTGYLCCLQKRRKSEVVLKITLTIDDIGLYRKYSGRLFRSIGCGPPRWIPDNDYHTPRYYQRLFRREFKIPPSKV